MGRNALQAEMRPTPRNALMGFIADALTQGRNFADKAQIPQGVPLVGGQGLGSLLVGKAPEELNEWSYGNAPMRINPNAGRTASYVPEMKPGRGGQVADLLIAAQVPGGKNALAMGAGALDQSMFNKAATVWHGSPHKFDRFDASKIGTGEGAQAYGHGLYLAESRKVADEYAGKLSKPTIQFATGIEATGDLSKLSPAARDVAQRMQASAEQTAYGSKADMAGRHLWGAPESVQRELIGNAERWRAFDVVDSGSLYKVDLPDEKIARMLNWDAPIFEQPAPVRGLAELWGSTFKGNGDAFGNHFMAEAYGRFGGPAGAADALRARGVPGVRYFDGASRSREAGTSNFVIFPGEENALTILERNGQRLK